MLSKESRIFMTFNESLGDMLTLAHESGHAYHGAMMRDVRPYARGYPMTLAETASTFGENVLMNGILDDPTVSDSDKARILDIEVGHGAVYLLDIPVRYEFEKSFYEERANGPLSVSRLKELMVQTQRRVLGDVLEPGGEDPYFWASKLHFYITGITFYNFPYTFGYLLSRGLYAMFKNEGDSFLPKYEEFLRRAGSDTAENVVQANRRPRYRESRILERSDSQLGRTARSTAEALAQSHNSTLVTRNSKRNYSAHPFQQRGPEQIDGIERHARAVVGAAAGAGAFTAQKSLAVGERNIGLAAREVLNLAVGIGDGVQRQAEIAARLLARRPSHLVGKRAGSFKVASRSMPLRAFFSNERSGIFVIADKAGAEVLTAGGLQALRQLAAGQILAGRHGLVFFAQQFAGDKLHGFFVGGENRVAEQARAPRLPPARSSSSPQRDRPPWRRCARRLGRATPAPRRSDCSNWRSNGRPYRPPRSRRCRRS